MDNELYCRSCGSSNSEKSKFCSECGTSLNDAIMVNAEEPTPDTCPNCKKNDKVESVTTIFQTQSSVVGYGKNRDLQQTRLAQVIMEALGPKPRPGIIHKLLFESSVDKDMQEYEAVASRWEISYHCARCDLFFFTYKNEKYSGRDFKTLLRDSLE